MLNVMSRGYVYLLLLDLMGQVGGSVEHSEGKGGDSVVAIPRFLCRVLWGPISRVAFVTTMSNHTSLLRAILLLLEGA
jgi:hypothetical protein